MGALLVSSGPVSYTHLMNRGVESEQEMREFLYGTLDDLHDPFLMKGMDEADVYKRQSFHVKIL